MTVEMGPWVDGFTNCNFILHWNPTVWPRLVKAMGGDNVHTDASDVPLGLDWVGGLGVD